MKSDSVATYSEAEVAAAIASVLDPEWNGVILREHVIRELLLFLPDPPEPEAAIEAARMILLEHGQKLR